LAIQGDDDDSMDFGDSVDTATFEQILEMDDDDDEREFSKGIVFGFFDQAAETFDKMEAAIHAGDLPELSSLGHFLKGSSATLGLTKIKDGCEKIQHFGAMKDETGTVDEPDRAKCLSLIQATLDEVKGEYQEVSALLRRFYNE
jgi:osomolarity two-component system phosphorelay intermediate protein YPD1